MHKNDLSKLKTWFQNESRELPWRNNATPYAVWVSEVMLQQTQVAVVIPYFERWMKRFPTIQALADAPLEEVLKEWEGLGYYSRARFLHQGAQYVIANFNGQLPNSTEKLKEIKGLGPYTIGAILSFAFHQRTPAVDGNVLRVLARYYGLHDDISKSKTLKLIQQLATDLLPQDEPWIISEALIELGATICTKNPKCMACPLQNSCVAYTQDLTDQLPVKTNKVVSTPLYRSVAVITSKDKLLIGKGLKGQIMADLYEFPYLELEAPIAEPDLLHQHLQESHQAELTWLHALQGVKHSFTRYHAHLFPHRFEAAKPFAVQNYEWVHKKDLVKLPFSSGHRRILAQL